LGKLTSKERLYLDYNATSPLSDSVIEYLGKGDFAFGNPSSTHYSGKSSRRYLRESLETISNIFKFTNTDGLFFHSGASEGINTIIKGFAAEHLGKGQSVHFYYSSVDHACVYNQKSELELYGHQAKCFPVDKNGEFDCETLISEINNSSKDHQVLLNYTWVNNETGVVWPLDQAQHIKEKTGCKIHVDAVQAPGKVDKWWQINHNLDAYSYSGHKFGALKGVGFSFIDENFPMRPLVLGGGQQRGHRSGTENILGIKSIGLALEELCKNDHYQLLNEAKISIEKKIKSLIKNKGEIVGQMASCRNANTIYFIVTGQKADVMTTAFDLAGIDVSTGSACSSGLTIASRVLKNMGYSEKDAKSAIRLSFGPDFFRRDAQGCFDRIAEVLSRFL